MRHLSALRLRWLKSVWPKQMNGANNYDEWKTIIFVATPCCNTDFSARERQSTGAQAHVCSSSLWSISENVNAALCLPSFSSLALLPPTISVLESAVRQQPARHEYKKRQTSKLRKKKESTPSGTGPGHTSCSKTGRQWALCQPQRSIFMQDGGKKH